MKRALKVVIVLVLVLLAVRVLSELFIG